MNEKNPQTSGEECIRINKFLSEAGVCSRREADRLIGDGRLTVNGLTAVSGQKVSTYDRICLDGRQVFLKKNKVLLLLYKPRGIVSSTKKQFSETTVTEYLDYAERVFPVGRLDKESEGLLLMTNEGDILNKILRAGNYHEKEYLVTVDRPVTEAFLKKMGAGVPILDTVTRPCVVRQTGKYSFCIILTQGLNRQIRRMCEFLGYRVTRLLRTRIMNLELGELKPGAYREITREEREELDRLLADSAGTSIFWKES